MRAPPGRSGRGGTEVGPALDTAKSYVSRLVDGDHEAAAELLSEESYGLVGEYLPEEPWLPQLVQDVTTRGDTGEGPRWSSYPAWEGADESTRVVTVRGVRSDSSPFYYAFGAREVDGQWVIDQDRLDTGTGAPWVLFLNPTMDGTIDEDGPLSFRVSNGSGAPQNVTFRVNGHAEIRDLEESVDQRGIVFSEPEVRFGMPGGYVALVTGQGSGDAMADMVRAHTVTFVATESDG
ncbi:hypothetical protein [Ornithinimicrobium panacihumi]|uniref:hypothetical protein n=1 Tax=Ornithinimicrobium panacihumi TaxID=2008449 RepID=UPI003F89466B